MTSNSSQDWQVFISCKVSDENDKNTRDWYIAKELYELLKANSIRVFMSSFSIEELGESAYKEVIEEALDEARIMVVVGTTKGNLNSKWVKYEWDSFHNEIISGRKLNGQILTVTDELANSDLPYALRYNQSYKTSEKVRLLNFIKRKLESFDFRQSITVEEIEEEKTEEIEEVGSDRIEKADENLETDDRSNETSIDVPGHESEEASADTSSEETKEETEEEKAEETLHDIPQEAPEEKKEDVVCPEKEQEQQPQIIQQDEKTRKDYLESSSQEQPSDMSLSPSLSSPISRITEGMVLVEKGSFIIGDEVGDQEVYSRPIHEVLLTN
ncbi:MULTISPECIES: toll/interleukin-1 receptor domain-containing protein, partial [unclassified Mesotoga]|uniref:toll/interleukin-1 receptor domain-containing protein n=1 Tax=unclassified Mesotoga TaxID=1184398 RepID=UPI0025D5376A